MKQSKVSKVGAKVTVTRRNGEKVNGKVVSVEDRRNGRWVTVNVAEPRKPAVHAVVRESQLTAF
jgi:hypothetical protein